jgi:small-conductance mechanosensitive channel
VEILQTLFETVRPALPAGVAVVVVIVLIYVVRVIIDRRSGGVGGRSFRRQMITMVLAFAGLLTVIMVSPLSDNSRGQLLGLIGILLTAAIALSSTTFLGNIMAGLMLRAVRNFRPGDFVRVGDHFGRVSEQGLFHVEIQTEDRDLTTMPNLYLVTNPVKVIRSSGTVISGDVSLGYDDPRKKVEKLLIEAAEAAGLQDPFVWVMRLGDFSVTYRVAGLLPEVKHVLSARSELHKKMLDKLHAGGIEIVSPTFMNTRALSAREPVLPGRSGPERDLEPAEGAPLPESVVFDKADEAESLEKLRERFEALGRQIKETKEKLDDTNNLLGRDALQADKEQLETRRERLAEYIKRREEKEEEK